MAEHEAVELRLGQLEGAGLLHGILGGDGQKRRRQPERVAADRDPPLLHGLQQGRLHLGRGPVDLVGQQQVGEDRAAVDVERAAGLVENLGADDVGRQQIDGELDSAELQIDRLGQGADQQRFGQARHALQEQVSAGEKGDQDAFDNDVLADNDLGNEAAHRGDQGVDALQWHAGCGEGLPIENAGGLHRRCLALVASHRRPSWGGSRGGSDFRCPMRSILAGFRRCCRVARHRGSGAV